MNQQRMILTDEKIFIKQESIKVIEERNQCFIITTNTIPEKFHICEDNNKESYNYLKIKYGFSGK